MKKALSIIGLIAVTVFISSCQSTNIEQITRFTVTDESVSLAEDTEMKHSVWVTVNYIGKDENNRLVPAVFADGPLVDGKLPLNRKVEEPTRVVISVNLGDPDNGRAIFTVLRPNDSFDFVLEYRSRKSFGVKQVGTNHRSIDENSRFSLVGDISSIEGFVSDAGEPRLTSVSVRAQTSTLDGSRNTLYFPSILVDEGKFSIDGDIDEPTLVAIELWEKITRKREVLLAILEPRVNYSVVPLGDTGKLTVQADKDSVHSRIMSSWQLDPAFVSLVEQRMDSKNLKQDVSEDLAARTEEFIRNYEIAEECEHLNVPDDIKQKFVEPLPSSFETLSDEIVVRRSTALREILQDVDDVNLAQLVFDLSWGLFDRDEMYTESDADERIATLKELARKMDQEFVDAHITPQVEDIEWSRDVVLTDRSLIPGQTAPEFSLTTIAGDEVSLSEVLSENELVLVDFWASWCGPCIRSFPALKKMYSKNKDQGFEIITISIDDSFEDWVDASKSQRFPWIDLGDTENGDMTDWKVPPSAKDYGVLGIPSKFLIDKKGCIVHKHFSDDELKELISTRLADTN